MSTSSSTMPLYGDARPTLVRSLREYARGIAGGLIFSLPLLYTMEVWWTGFTATPARLMACVGGVFVLLLGYNRYAGMHHDATWLEVAIDSVEEMGLGLMVAAGMLLLLGRITFETAADAAIGKMVIGAMTVAIGISVGTAQLGLGAVQVEGEDGEGSGLHRSARVETSFHGQIAIAACGAVLFAANVAPTEEVLVIAAEAPAVALIGQVLVSLALGASILHHIEFSGSHRHVRRDGPSTVVFEAVVTYAIALVVSAAILWFFGRLDECCLAAGVARTVVLGLPATLGASAGRLLLQ